MGHDEIRDIAEKLLREFPAEHLPIDVFGLIEKKGLNIIFEEIEDEHSGFLLVEKGKATVAINSGHHINRQRFTAAHELGHYMLHAKGTDHFFADQAFQRSVASSTGEDTIEVDANRFAAEILMPKNRIEEKAGGKTLTDVDVYRLALDFRVSEQAMTLRLVNLRLIANL